MDVAYQCRNPAAPGLWQVRQLDRNSPHPGPGSIRYSIETDQQSTAEKCSCEVSSLHMQPKEPADIVDDPARTCRQKTETQDAQPDCRNLVEQAYQGMRIAPG